MAGNAGAGTIPGSLARTLAGISQFIFGRSFKSMRFLESVLSALGALVLTFGAAYVGSRFPVDEWYTSLTKPPWNPPNWLFGPVWSVLYLLMAI